MLDIFGHFLPAVKPHPRNHSRARKLHSIRNGLRRYTPVHRIVTMRFVVLLVALFRSREALMSQDSSCCTLDVKASTDQPAELHVVITNLQEAQVGFLSWLAPDVCLRVNVLGENGRMPALTKRGELILSGRRLNGGMQQTKPLDRGEKLSEVLDLRTLYTFTKGRYVVTVFRDVYIGAKRIELQGKTTITIP